MYLKQKFVQFLLCQVIAQVLMWLKSPYLRKRVAEQQKTVGVVAFFKLFGSNTRTEMPLVFWMITSRLQLCM